MGFRKQLSATVKGKSCSLFEIRLENDFIVFRGHESESAGQVIRGVVVLCISSPLKVEDVHLRLTGTLRHNWIDNKSTPSGQHLKVDRTTSIFEHCWAPFARATTLPPGNYEWPFETTLPGNTAESVEGINEASITYRLKATVGRGKLTHDLHAYKHLRVIRTLEPGALELLHSMAVENTWPNKVDYSIALPQKAVVFGAVADLEMRFTPLLKGLEMGGIKIRLMEIRECSLPGATPSTTRDHKIEKEVAHWKFDVQEEHWTEMIEETGQDGWVLTKKLPLPKRLGQCVQDLNHHGIKIRHKIKLTVALKNPDGHISELRATLPISIFISPNMPLDEQGNLVDQFPGTHGADSSAASSIAPPGYGEHILDQLYEDVDPTGFRTPAIVSGVNTPLYSHSGAASTENLNAMLESTHVPPATLTSILESLPESTSPSARPASFAYFPQPGSPNGHSTSYPSLTVSAAPSRPMSRSNSQEGHSDSTEHLDFPTLEALRKCPSYSTAVKTPVRLGDASPNYTEAINESGPPSPTDMEAGDAHLRVPRRMHRPLSVTSGFMHRFHLSREDDHHRGWLFPPTTRDSRVV